MKKLLLIFLLFSLEALALEAVVTVLETPILKDQDINSPVVKYLRKGDVIKIHPPFDGEFIITVDRQGKIAYVMSQHLYIYYKDSREFSQNVLNHDPTDYRLAEPLPKGYPLRPLSGYRGQLLLGATQTYTESYPYKDEVKTKGYQTPMDLRAVFLKQVSYDTQDRFYFGGVWNVRFHQNEYAFFDRRTAQEKGLKTGLGPYISYDAYKGHKDRLNMYGAVIFYFFNQLNITQSSESARNERLYRAYNFSPQIGLQYHRKNVHENVDLVVGSSIEVETPATFQAKNAGSQEAWWSDLGNDKFTTRTTFSIAGYVGFQAAY